MPQMMPINWLISFFFFIIIFIIFNIMNYYVFNMKLKMNKNIIFKKKINSFLWKW